MLSWLIKFGATDNPIYPTIESSLGPMATEIPIAEEPLKPIHQGAR
jgi:hypothetical protein